MTGYPNAWSDPAPDRPIPFLSALADLRAHIPVDRLGGSWPRLRTAEASDHRAVVGVSRHASLSFGTYTSWPVRAAWPPRRGNPFLVDAAFLHLAIASTARLHGGLILPHPQGIVVGDGVVVGPRAWIFQNVTLGGAPGKTGLPQVGADARIFTGAVLTGPIVVGDNVVIGANTVVHRDVPSHSIVRPAAVELVPSEAFFGDRPFS